MNGRVRLMYSAGQGLKGADIYGRQETIHFKRRSGNHGILTLTQMEATLMIMFKGMQIPSLPAASYETENKYFHDRISSLAGVSIFQ